MEQRTCPVCRRSFTPTHHNQRFCPPTAENRSGVAGQPRSYCARAYVNAKQRGTLDALLAEPRLPPEPFDCAQCGTRCVPGENVAAHATKFCGSDCKAAWHREHEDGANRRWHEERARIARLRVPHLRPQPAPDPLRQPTREQVVAYERRVLIADPCAYCGGPAGYVDHIDPRHNGGTDGWENGTAACHRCNGRKSITPLLLFLGWDRAQREFEPWRVAIGSLYRGVA